MIRKIRKQLLILFLGCTIVSIAQNQEIMTAYKQTLEGHYSNAIVSFELIDTTLINIEDKALLAFYLGYTYNLNDQQDLAYKNMLRSKTIYQSLDKRDDVKDCNLQLLSILNHQNKLKRDTQPILDELEAYMEQKRETDPNIQYKIYRRIGSNFLTDSLPEKAEEIFLKSLKISTENNDSLQISFDLMNIGTAKKNLKVYDSSLYYTKLAAPYLIKVNDSLNLSYNYNNQAEAYKFLKDYDTALEYYFKADSILPNKNRKKSKIVFYENLSDLFLKMGSYEEAYKIFIKKRILEDSIQDDKQNTEITEIIEQYDNKRLRANNLEIEAKRTQNRNIALGLGGGLTAVSIFAFLVYKNTRRKQRIAEQEKELEIQKKEKVLKDQELNAIDAMIEGQEKERQRLASDLHDSVGATLSAAKLQFDHIAKNRDKLEELQELFDKTGSLLEEAYTEVRSMAHLKNSGVIASKGLLPAVEKLAKNASSSGGLSIEVQDFGLHEKLEASLEIAIFRVIQELITNIIKHAQATEAQISITQHEDMLNIIVEDNGKGFNPKKMKKTEGMGLHGIEKRVEHLEGTLEVDAALGRGTNILIDIPL